GLVDDLIGNHEIARAEFLAQTSHRAAGEDVRAAELFQREDVGAIRHLRRVQQMPGAVPREQQRRNAGPAGFENRTTRRPKGRLNLLKLKNALFRAECPPQPRPADHADAHFTAAAHCCSKLSRRGENAKSGKFPVAIASCWSAESLITFPVLLPTKLL